MEAQTLKIGDFGGDKKYFLFFKFPFHDGVDKFLPDAFPSIFRKNRKRTKFRNLRRVIFKRQTTNDPIVVVGYNEIFEMPAYIFFAPIQ